MLAFSLVHIPYVLAVCEAVVCKSLGETIHSGTLTKTHTHVHAHCTVGRAARSVGVQWCALYAVKQTLSHTDSSQVTNGLTAPVSDKLLGTLSPADLYTHTHTYTQRSQTSLCLCGA